MMNRRSFLALASGLLVPVPEPVRRYVFAPVGGWPSGVLEVEDSWRAEVIMDKDLRAQRVLYDPTTITLRFLGKIERIEVKGVIETFTGREAK